MIKQTLITDIVNSMQHILSPEQLNILNDTLILKFENYNVKEMHTELMSPDDIDQKLLLNFLTTKKIEGKSEKTLKRYKEIISMFISNSNESLYKTTTNNLRYYLLNYKEKRHVSNRTLDGMRRCLSSFFTWLSKEGYINNNPCIGLSQIKYTKIIKKPFSTTEMERLKQNCDNIRDLALIEFLYFSGCRVSEVVNLNRDNINFTSGEAIVLGKGNKERTIYLTPIAIMRLQDYLISRTDNNPCLFASLKPPYNRLSKAGIENVLRKLGIKTDIKNVHPHRYRRTLATNLLNRGANIQDVATILGHSDLKTTQIYCYISQDSVKASYRKYAI